MYIFYHSSQSIASDIEMTNSQNILFKHFELYLNTCYTNLIVFACIMMIYFKNEYNRETNALETDSGFKAVIQGNLFDQNFHLIVFHFQFTAHKTCSILVWVWVPPRLWNRK